MEEPFVSNFDTVDPRGYDLEDLFMSYQESANNQGFKLRKQRGNEGQIMCHCTFGRDLVSRYEGERQWKQNVLDKSHGKVQPCRFKLIFVQNKQDGTWSVSD